MHNSKTGVVKNYDGYLGEIETEEILYYFTKNDILENEIIKNDDIVIFKGKTEDVFPQAYFIRKAK